MSSEARARERQPGGTSGQPETQGSGCCPYYHEAVEMIGRRWTGAIVAVLLDGGPMRFSEVGHAVPQLSDRLLSERVKELEARGVVTRTVEPGPPVRVLYELTDMGRSLEPALRELESWARRWLRGGSNADGSRSTANR
jgi:DNA-binding HxlR family transcriptional regulator